MAIIDSHVHVWSDDRAVYPTAPGLERPFAERGGADWLIAEMDAAGVAAALLAQTPRYGEDNRYLIAIMRRFPGRFTARGCLADPLAPDSPARLERHSHADDFRGLRLHLTDTRVNAACWLAPPAPSSRRRASWASRRRSSTAARRPRLGRTATRVARRRASRRPRISTVRSARTRTSQ